MSLSRVAMLLLLVLMTNLLAPIIPIGKVMMTLIEQLKSSTSLSVIFSKNLPVSIPGPTLILPSQNLTEVNQSPGLTRS